MIAELLDNIPKLNPCLFIFSIDERADAEQLDSCIFPEKGNLHSLRWNLLITGVSRCNQGMTFTQFGEIISGNRKVIEVVHH